MWDLFETYKFENIAQVPIVPVTEYVNAFKYSKPHIAFSSCPL
jgi:hypothetical protein